MNRRLHYLFVIALILFVQTGYADDVSDPLPNLPTRTQFLTEQSPEIQKAFTLYEKTGNAPIVKTTQFMEFPFDNNTQPIVTCTPLRACDITLEPGESVTGINVGDSERWLYDELVSGDNGQKCWHVIIKPKDYNLSTNVIITTSRRTYYLGLLSSPNEDTYVRQVKFYYPDDLKNEWQAINTEAAKETASHSQTVVATLPDIDLSKINDNYSIIAETPLFGHAPTWTPTHVFNDGGQQVFIQMPPVTSRSDLPALFTLNSDGTKTLVNYRIKDNWFIVDDIFKEAVLVSGVGMHQQSVLIRYYGREA